MIVDKHIVYSTHCSWQSNQ